MTNETEYKWPKLSGPPTYVHQEVPVSLLTNYNLEAVSDDIWAVIHRHVTDAPYDQVEAAAQAVLNLLLTRYGMEGR